MWMTIAGIGAAILILALLFAPNTLLFIIGGGMLLSGALDVLSVELGLQKALRDPEHKQIRKRWRGIFSEEKMSFECEDGTISTVPWPSFSKIEVYGDDYLLYTMRYGAMIVFRRFQTEEQWAQFTAWADRRKAELDRVDG